MTFNLVLAQEIVYVYLVRILASIGIVGNVLNLVILRQKTLHDSPYTYLKALAIADLFVLTIILGIGLVRCGNCELTIQQQYWGRLYEFYIYLPFINMAGNCSVFITVAMTVERFLFVRLPLSAKKVCHRRRARRIILGALLLAIIINVPRCFLYIIDRVEEHVPGYISIQCSLSPTRRDLLAAKQHSISEQLGPKCYYSPEASIKTLMKAVKGRYQKEHHENQPASIFIWRASPAEEAKQKQQENKMHSFPSMIPSMQRTKVATPPKYDLTISKCIENNDDRVPGRNREPFYFNWTDFHLKYFKISTDPTKKYFYQKEFGPQLFSAKEKGVAAVVVMNITDTEDIRYFLDKFPCLTDTKLTSSFELSPWNVTLDPVVEIKVTTFYQNYKTFVYALTLVFEAGGFFAMAILNIVLIYLVRKRCRDRKKLLAIPRQTVSKTTNSNCASKDQIRLTVTLVSITALTMVGCILSATSNPLFFCIKVKEPDETFYAVISIVTNVFMLMSHSINFLVYALINRRFRTAFCNVFLCRKRTALSNLSFAGRTPYQSQSINNNLANNNNDDMKTKYINYENDSKINNVTEELSLSAWYLEQSPAKKINDINTLQPDYYKFDFKL